MELQVKANRKKGLEPASRQQGPVKSPTQGDSSQSVVEKDQKLKELKTKLELRHVAIDYGKQGGRELAQGDQEYEEESLSLIHI